MMMTAEAKLTQALVQSCQPNRTQQPKQQTNTLQLNTVCSSSKNVSSPDNDASYEPKKPYGKPLAERK
jgi:hypothetical protein